MENDNRIQVLDKANSDTYSVINKIIKKGAQNEGFCLCNVSNMVRKNENWKKCFPKIPIFYAVKCNDSRVVLETQVALGNGFSCVSQEEIRKIISLGVSPQNIIFSNPTKKISHLVYAAEMGIPLTTFESEEELYKIKKYYPSVKLLIRMDTDGESDIEVFDRKYGVHSLEEATYLLNIAKSLNLNVIGVAFYVGSDYKDKDKYSKAIAEARKIFDIAAKEGFNFSLLDIGSEYSGKKQNTILEVSTIINKAIDIHFKNINLKIMTEVGKHCVESAFKTVSKIHSKKILENNIRMYYLDIGIYNGLLPVTFKDFFVCKPLKEQANGPLYPSILWGPTCDSVDQISNNTDNLPEMDIGEWVIFEDTGANTLPLTYEFNGFTSPFIHAIIEEKDWFLLTESIPKPLAKSKFVTGDSIDAYLTGLNATYVYKEQ